MQRLSEDRNFEEGALYAGKDALIYNSVQEEGNIYTVLKNSSKKYVDNFEVIKGELYYFAPNEQTKKWAQEIGIKISPYKIVDGELISDDINVGLRDETTGSIIIPQSVTKIGEGAFAKVDVRTLVIPPTVKEISRNAFRGNTTLEEVIFQTRIVNGKEEGLEKIGEFAFFECRKLKTIKMPNTVTTIGEEVFNNCTSLSEVVLSNNLTQIPYHSFAYCSSITEIVIPEKVKKIEVYAMRNCNSLKSVTITKGLENIATSTFLNCKNLNTINIIENENFKFKEGVLLNKDETNIIFLSASVLQQGDTFNVPNKVKSLGGGLIDGYSNIKKVQIPASVTSIGVEFYTTSLTHVEIDENNPNYCSTGEVIYNKEKTILYKHLNTRTNVNIEEGVNIIGERAFWGCSNLTSVTLPNSLTEIWYEGFAVIENLKSIHIGKNLRSLNPMTFWCSINITDFTIDEANEFYETDGTTIYNKGRTKIVTVLPLVQDYTIPSGITEIGNTAFYNQSIKEITIPEGVTSIRK